MREPTPPDPIQFGGVPPYADIRLGDPNIGGQGVQTPPRRDAISVHDDFNTPHFGRPQ